MNTTYAVLLTIAILIILLLAGYAWYLLRQVKKSQAQQQQEHALAEMNLRKRQQDLLKDIRFIARAVIEEQCEITEGVMRLHYLVTALDRVAWEAAELASGRRHHEKTAAMPILDAYKALTPRQQFALDKERLSLEDEHQASIRQELKWLVKYPFPNVTLIQ